MFIDEILNEGTNNISLEDQYNIEPTNEGYDNMSVVIMEDVEDTKKLNIALEAVDYLMFKEIKSADTINEGVSEIGHKIKQNILSAVKKIKEILGKMWSKVKEVYQTLKMKVFSVTSLDKFINIAKKQLEDLKDFKGVEIEGFDFKISEGPACVKNINSSSTKYILSCMAKFNAVSKKKAQEEKSVHDAVDGTVKELNEIVRDDKFKEFVLKSIGTTTQKMNTDIYKKLRANVSTKKTIKISSPSNALSYLDEYKKTLSDISILEAETNNSYNESMKELDNMISLIPKTEDGNKYASVLQNIAKLSKSRNDIINRIVGITITAAKECKSQSITIVKKCISQGKSNKKEADKKKSERQSVNADTDLLSSIMDRI